MAGAAANTATGAGVTVIVLVCVIVLAQASMSRLAVVLQEKTKMTVLSSPRLGVDYLADRLAEIQA